MEVYVEYQVILTFFCVVQSVYLIYYQQHSHTSLEYFWLVVFQFQLHFCVGKLYKYHQHKVTSHWQQLRASHLCKVETKMDLN